MVTVLKGLKETLTHLASNDWRSDHELDEPVHDNRQEAHQWTTFSIHQLRHALLELRLKVVLPNPRRYLMILGTVGKSQETVQILILKHKAILITMNVNRSKRT